MEIFEQPQVEFDTVTGDGFAFRIPRTYGRRECQSDQGDWAYYECLYPSVAQEDWRQTGVELFACYWTRFEPEFTEERILQVCRELSERELFEPGYELNFLETMETLALGFPAMRIQAEFRSPELEASGPVRFYACHNTEQERLYILTVLVEQGLIPSREEAVMQLLEDHVLASFHFLPE